MVNVSPISAGSRILDEDLAGWRTGINSKLDGIVKVKASDTTRASTTTYSADPHLQASVAASTVYDGEIVGVYQAAATPQIKFQFTFPAGATVEALTWHYDPGADEWGNAGGGISQSSPANVVVGLSGTGANTPFRLNFALLVGAAAGTFSLDWAQNVSNATGTILRKGTKLRLLAAN
jgi:hypothetical protein